jgi:O-antigen/teichoic acid export membrane protein
MLIQGFGALLAYVVQVVFARWLGPGGYGAFSIALAVTQGVAIVAAFGMPLGVLRFVPQYIASRDRAHLRGLLRFSLGLPVITGVSFGAVSGMVFRALGFPWAFALAIASLIPLTAVALVATDLVRSTSRVALAYLPHYIVRPLVMLTGGWIVVRRFADPSAAVGVAAVAVMTIILVLVLFVRMVFRAHAASAEARSAPREWLRITVPLMLMSFVAYVVNQVDVIVVGSVLGLEHAGIYSAAQRTAAVVGFVLFASNAVVGPAIARCHASGDVVRMRNLVIRVNRWTFVVALVGSLAIVLAAPLLLRLFGLGFQGAIVPLFVLVGAKAASAFVGPVGYVLGLTGHERTAAVIQTTFGVFGLGMTAVLAHLGGITGAAVGSAVGLIAVNLGLAIATWRVYRISPLGLASSANGST